jgi:hypothetical protein
LSYSSMLKTILIRRFYIALLPLFISIFGALWSCDLTWCLWGLLYCIPCFFVTSALYLFVLE